MASLLAFGDDVRSMEHTWDVPEDAQNNVDEQVHAKTPSHQDGEGREDDGDDVGDDLGAVHCVVSAVC